MTHEGGGGVLGKKHWGLVIGKSAQQRTQSPTWTLPELVASQSWHHAPLC